MPAHMVREHVSIFGIAAGDTCRNDNADGLALVEGTGALCPSAVRVTRNEQGAGDQSDVQPHDGTTVGRYVSDDADVSLLKCCAVLMSKRCAETSVRPLVLAPSEKADTCRISRSSSPTFSNQ